MCTVWRGHMHCVHEHLCFYKDLYVTIYCYRYLYGHPPGNGTWPSLFMNMKAEVNFLPTSHGWITATPKALQGKRHLEVIYHCRPLHCNPELCWWSLIQVLTSDDLVSEIWWNQISLGLGYPGKISGHMSVQIHLRIKMIILLSDLTLSCFFSLEVSSWPSCFFFLLLFPPSGFIQCIFSEAAAYYYFLCPMTLRTLNFTIYCVYIEHQDS